MSNFDYVLGVAAAGLDDLYGGDMEDDGYANVYYDDYDYDDDDLDFDNDHTLGYAALGHEPFLDDRFPDLVSEPSLPVHSSPVPWSDDLSDSDPYEEDRDDDDLDTTVSLHEGDLPGWGNTGSREGGGIRNNGNRHPSAGGSSAAPNNSSSSSPSPPPYPAAAVWPEPISRESSLYGSASNLFVDSDVPSARSPASPAASASSGANPAPQHRASPRRSSLTPTIHPNRRLPRPANLQQQRQPNHRHLPRHRLSVYDHFDSIISRELLSSDPDDFSPPVRASAAHDIPRAIGGGGFGSGSGSGPGSSANAQPTSPHSRLLRPGLAHLLDSDSEEASQAALPRQSRLQPSRDRQAASEPQEARAPSAGIPWDSDFDWGAEMDMDDELIEVIVDRHRQAPSVQEQGQQGQHHEYQQQRRRHRHMAHPRQPMQGGGSSNLERQDAAAIDVIDLTEEPDSPVLLHHRPVNLRRNAGADRAIRQQIPRNSRRQMSQVGRTPSLARSDGSILGQAHPAAAVIDLTNNSDEDLDIPFNRRLPAPVPAARRDNRRSVEVVGLGRHYMPALAELGNLGRIRDFFPGFIAARLGAHNNAEVQIIGAHQFAMNANPLAGNQPAFNYQANGFGGRQPTPKPEFQPPPPARSGFTRDTGLEKETDEEMVIVCASCDNELKYSANEEDDGGPRPAKRPRTKKDREEHHFWAVKTCGHVYCKQCYDNRKKTKSKDYEKLGFQVDHSHKTPKIFCAVDQCNSDVTSTQVWVGIFM